MNSKITNWLSENGFGIVIGKEPVFGGCINDSSRLIMDSGKSFFLKFNKQAPVDMFTAESEGLYALSQRKALETPKVIYAGQDFILLEDLGDGKPNRSYWKTLGEGLAKLHDQLNATMIYVTHDQTEAMTLANDIVVLDEGIVSQKGSPMDLYNDPNNLFVGGFIGSPKMNFISTKITSKSSDKTEVDLMGSAKISIPKTSASASEGDAVQLGIRPEHLIVNQDGDGSWESKVFVVEKLGSGTFLYLEKEGEPLVVETEGDSNIKVGDTVKVGFSASRCHLFDNSQQAFK